jgi:hypothetical protein
MEENELIKSREFKRSGRKKQGNKMRNKNKNKNAKPLLMSILPFMFVPPS